MAIERDTILELETHLAAQTTTSTEPFTEEQAVLLSQVILMDPMGPARRVPPFVMEQLRQLNKTYKLGHLFCRSRKPDLLLDIIQRQGTTQSMPWLSDLVQNSEGDFNHLPVQCLCEFLLFNASNINEENSRDAELVNYLRNLITNPESNKQSVCEVLDYIFRRLSSTLKQSRRGALDGLKIIFRCSPQDPNGWLLRSIPQLPYFKEVLSYLIPQLRAACQVENIPELIMTYIQFIAAHTLDDSVPEMLDHVMDMTQLIIERSTMFQYIIPSATTTTTTAPSSTDHIMDYMEENRFQTLNCLFVMFNNYIIKLREHHEPYEWTEYPDLLMVHFDDGVQLPLHLNIIHSFIILLTRASVSMPESLPIIDYWFPPERSAPMAYFPNAPHEPVQILPDWLKLKMLRSSIDRLIDAALRDLKPDQIVLFVQNFGTPVYSMSKLLAILDRAVIEQFDVVKAAIMNKSYLAYLIETQQVRGAKNGHITIQALELHTHSQFGPDLPKMTCQLLETVDEFKKFEPIPLTESTTTTITTAVAGTLTTNISEEQTILQLVLKGIKLDRQQATRFRRLVVKLQQNPTNKQDNDILLLQLLEIVSKWQNENFFDENIEEKRHCITFFRVFVQQNPILAENRKYLMKTLQDVEIKLKNWYEKYKNSEDDVVMIEECNEEQIKVQEKQKERDGIASILYNSLLNMIRNVLAKNQELEEDKLEEKKVTKVKPEGIRAILGVNEQTNACQDVNLVFKALEKPQNVELFANNEQNSKSLCLKGLLVDWLAEVDPEFRNGDKQLQRNFLFSRTHSDFRYYMLSLICHHTHWQTLHDTLQHVLFEDKSVQLDSSTVLNFMEALINNPKLWQGRDKTVAKCEQPEVILSLKGEEIERFAQLVLQEGEQELDQTGNNYDYKLCGRIKLLFRVIPNKCKGLIRFIECIQNSECASILRLKVLQQVYLMYPSIKFIKYEKAGEELVGQLQGLTGCRADRVTNYLITCLANLFLKKDFEALSSDTEMLMRKLAASHPALFLRQLGVLSSMIQGRVEFNLRALRDEYHLHRFVQILRTLELLQPMVFDDAYKQELQASLSCYFNFFKNYSYAKETYNVLIKFVELLQGYINANPSSALVYIEQYVGLLMELSAKFYSIGALHQLVQGIALLQHKSRTSTELTEDEVKQDIDLNEKITDTKACIVSTVAATTTDILDGSDVMAQDLVGSGSGSKGTMALATMSNASSNKYQSVSPHFLNLIKIIKNSNSEDAILGPLQEIESLTSKRFAFLSELFDRLLELIFSPSAQIRSNAFILLIRHIKHNPGRADINRCTLNAYIQCLRDDNPSVATTAVDNLAEMSLLLQEHAVEILSVAFSLGIRSRLTTCTQIKRVVQTLTLQNGY